MSLNPTDSRQAREAARAEAAAQPQLEPDFPYTNEPFDPFRFNLQQEVDSGGEAQ